MEEHYGSYECGTEYVHRTQSHVPGQRKLCCCRISMYGHRHKLLPMSEKDAMSMHVVNHAREQRTLIQSFSVIPSS